MRLTAALFSLATLASTPALPFGVVDLDRPGALDTVRQENPEHHRRVTGILAAATEMPCETRRLERAAVEYHAREAHCAVYLMTSYPARRKLSFVLDTTTYRATVTLATQRDRVRKVED